MYLECWRQRHADADHNLQTFPNRQVWPDDVVCPHEEDVANIPASVTNFDLRLLEEHILTSTIQELERHGKMSSDAG